MNLLSGILIIGLVITIGLLVDSKISELNAKTELRDKINEFRKYIRKNKPSV